MLRFFLVLAAFSGCRAAPSTQPADPPAITASRQCIESFFAAVERGDGTSAAELWTFEGTADYERSVVAAFIDHLRASTRLVHEIDRHLPGAHFQMQLGQPVPISKLAGGTFTVDGKATEYRFGQEKFEHLRLKATSSGWRIDGDVWHFENGSSVGDSFLLGRWFPSVFDSTADELDAGRLRSEKEMNEFANRKLGELIEQAKASTRPSK